MRLLKYGRLGLILICVLCFSGCWDIIPIEERALVMVIGVDKVDNRIRLSAQVPTIKNLIQTASKFTNRQKPMVKPFVVESASMLDAIQQVEDRMHQSIIIGTVKVIVISGGLAEQDLVNVLTIFLRQPMVSYQTLILCSADNHPDEIIRFEAPFDLQPGLIIVKQQRSALKLVRSFPIKLWDFIARIDNGISDPFLPVIKLDPKNTSYVLQGIKVFNKAKPVGTLSSDESYVFGILTGKVEEAYREITVKNQQVGFSKVAYQPKIRIIKRQNQAMARAYAIRAEINTQGTLLQIPKGFPNRVDTYRLFKKELENQLEKEILSVVKKLQLLNTDPVGFRKQMEIAGIKNWSEAYPNIPVEVKVRFKYRNLAPAF
jgi:Ger(x)C family germination protein